MKPIAVLIPVYNRQEGFEKTLLSLEPELHLLDIVVVDDGSVPAIHADRFPGWPIRLIRLDWNQGVEEALNAGLRYIYEQDYTFIARIDSDDCAIHQRFQKQLAFMEAHPEVGILGGQARFITQQGAIERITAYPSEDEALRKLICKFNPFVHPAMLLRGSVAKQAGYYSKHFKAAEDYDFFWRIMRLAKAANLPDVILDYEMDNPHSISNSKRAKQVFSTFRVKLAHFDAFSPWAYIGILRSLAQIAFLPRCMHPLRDKIKRLCNGYAKPVV